MPSFRYEFSLLANSLLFASTLAFHAQTNVNPLRVIALGVRDQRGQFVEGIKADEIVIKGPVTGTQYLELDKKPRRILLLLDASGSMGDYKSASWLNVAQFARRFTLQRSGNDSIGLDTFAENDRALVPFTTDSQLVVKYIDSVKSSGRGRTMLGRALAEIMARGEAGLRFGDAIILVSDGDRSLADKTDFVQLRDELIHAGIRICLVRVPSLMGPGVTVGVSDALPIVSDTGGMELNMVNRLSVQYGGGARIDSDMSESTAKAAYSFVRTYYRVGLGISGPITKPNPLHLELVDHEGRKLKGAQLTYPRYLSK